MFKNLSFDETMPRIGEIEERDDNSYYTFERGIPQHIVHPSLIPSSEHQCRETNKSSVEYIPSPPSFSVVSLHCFTPEMGTYENAIPSSVLISLSPMMDREIKIDFLKCSFLKISPHHLQLPVCLLVTYNDVCHNINIVKKTEKHPIQPNCTSMYVMLCYVICIVLYCTVYLLNVLIYKLFDIPYSMLCYLEEF